MTSGITNDFKDALRHFASGVTIVTMRAGDRVHGLTVSAFASVSADPPLIAVIINQENRAHTFLDEDGATFAVNILGNDQQELSDRFAWLKDGDRFSDGDWQETVTGAPVLADALAWLDCTIHERLAAGTHTIFVGRVRAVGVPRPDEAPLVYWNRGYRRLDAVDEAEPALARSA